MISFAPGLSEDTIMDAALKAGADDVITYDDGAIDVYTTPDAFGEVTDALEAAGLTPESSEVALIPSTPCGSGRGDRAEITAPYRYAGRLR